MNDLVDIDMSVIIFNVLQLHIDMALYVRAFFKRAFMEVNRIQVHANCRLRMVSSVLSSLVTFILRFFTVFINCVHICPGGLHGQGWLSSFPCSDSPGICSPSESHCSVDFPCPATLLQSESTSCPRPTPLHWGGPGQIAEFRSTYDQSPKSKCSTILIGHLSNWDLAIFTTIHCLEFYETLALLS